MLLSSARSSPEFFVVGTSIVVSFSGVTIYSVVVTPSMASCDEFDEFLPGVMTSLRAVDFVASLVLFASVDLFASLVLFASVESVVESVLSILAQRVVIVLFSLLSF